MQIKEVHGARYHKSGSKQWYAVDSRVTHVHAGTNILFHEQFSILELSMRRHLRSIYEHNESYINQTLFILLLLLGWPSSKEKVIAAPDYESVSNAGDEGSALEKKEAGDCFICI